jgi:hypothetical protein
LTQLRHELLVFDAMLDPVVHSKIVLDRTVEYRV